MIFEHSRWLGNIALPVVGFTVLACQMGRRNRPAWLNGAIVGTVTFLLSASSVFAYEKLLWHPPPHTWFGPLFVLIWCSALPIQTPLNLLFGEDNFAEENLLLPTAILTWGLVGGAIGILVSRIKKRYASP